MRRVIAFPCSGDRLIATLDPAAGTTGLLIVSGGNEVRAGAHRGMASLAGDIAQLGHPVFRYDRRGVGDSSGINAGFLSARDDLTAATAAFRAAMPDLTRIMGFGNCDGASTLALFGQAAGLDRVLLANPWTQDDPDDLPPRAAIRERYAARLRRPAEWRRLLTGGVKLRNLIRGLKKLSTKAREDLSTRVLTTIDRWGPDATIVLADRDATAIAFAAAERRTGLGTETLTISSDSHSFVYAADREALLGALLRLLA